LTVGKAAVLAGNPDNFLFIADTCTNATIGPGSSCAITIRFTPRSAGGIRARLVIPGNGRNSPQTVALDGTGQPTPPGAASIKPASLSFGPQEVTKPSSARTVTLTNSGASPLTVGHVVVTGANAGDFAVSADACSTQSLAPGASCTVDVRFTPGAEGARGAGRNWNGRGRPGGIGDSATPGF
jgi:hypothetical protein